MITQHQILTSEECVQVKDKVIALRDRWTPHSNWTNGFYLGAAAHQCQEKLLYSDAVKQSHAVLDQEFDFLYAKLKSGLEPLLEESILFSDQHTLPGFHVFVLTGEDMSRDRVTTRAHFDIQYQVAFPHSVPEKTLSLTLSIESPSGGSSMAIWTLRYEDAIRTSVCDFVRKNQPEIINHQTGYVILHDGRILHAIGTFGVTHPQGYRITLQGHGISTPSGWLLYW